MVQPWRVVVVVGVDRTVYIYKDVICTLKSPLSDKTVHFIF